MAAVAWTPEEDALLTRLAAEGARAQHIADRLQTRTKRAVIGRAHRLDVDLLAKRGGITSTSGNRRRSPRPGERVKNAAMSTYVPYVPNRSQVHSPYPKRIDELPPNGCKFPITRDDEGEWLLCGLPRLKRAYCAGHYAEAYQPPNPNRKRA